MTCYDVLFLEDVQWDKKHRIFQLKLWRMILDIDNTEKLVIIYGISKVMIMFLWRMTNVIDKTIIQYYWLAVYVSCYDALFSIFSMLLYEPKPSTFYVSWYYLTKWDDEVTVKIVKLK